MKGSPPEGMKKAKERVSIGLMASAEGEMLPPVFIHKSHAPRVFKQKMGKAWRPDPKNLLYHSNKKAWMDSKVSIACGSE